MCEKIVKETVTFFRISDGTVLKALGISPNTGLIMKEEDIFSIK